CGVRHANRDHRDAPMRGIGVTGRIERNDLLGDTLSCRLERGRPSIHPVRIKTSLSQSFLPRANAEPDFNPQLVIVDGAQSSMTADIWADPTSQPWTVLGQRLANAGVTPNQVEVAWIKEAEPHPATLGAFPTHAQVLERDLEAIVRNLHTMFPNLRIAYVSSRTHAFTTVPAALSPEPYAYESGFATQWLIANQIHGTNNLNYDPANGAVVAPWLSWGPYLWADGTTPRSDGLSWDRADVQGDGIHPSQSGDAKVADQLLAFFQTD